jgi:4-hydroxy-tetrahydrodipicolinate reductase
MKIALLGYGKMGKEIEIIARERNHQIVLIIDVVNLQEFTTENLSKADVAIDFSTPASAYPNILKCFEAGIPLVCGTTGWLNRLDEVKSKCTQHGGTFFYASNFSVGVNIFFALNKYLARIMNTMGGYDVSMKEIHHIHKMDAPSGTAITLAGDLISLLQRKDRWELNRSSDPASIKITAMRENEIPGTHIVNYESFIDCIEISHIAKNRKGFATGALMAAEYVQDKKGIFTMEDLLKLEML